MLFSVIVPVYNMEKYLPECLASMEAQVYQGFELILIDDGSTDRSGNMCDQYAQKHPNTRVIHKLNEGLVLTRRRGIREAKGEYIIFSDSDDYISPCMLDEIRKAIFKKHPDMVMYGYNVVDNEKNVLGECYDAFPDGTEFNSQNMEELLYVFSSTVWLNSMDTKATRRVLFDADTDYSEYRSIRMGEDQLQVIPLFRKIKTACFIGKPLCYYRNNPGGISKNITPEYLSDYLTVSGKLEQFLLDVNAVRKTMMAFYNRFILDAYKYLLRFGKKGLDKSEYENCYQKIIRHETYQRACLYRDQWEKRNLLLSKIICPDKYYISRFLGKTLLASKV